MRHRQSVNAPSSGRAAGRSHLGRNTTPRAADTAVARDNDDDVVGHEIAPWHQRLAANEAPDALCVAIHHVAAHRLAGRVDGIEFIAHSRGAVNESVQLQLAGWAATGRRSAARCTPEHWADAAPDLLCKVIGRHLHNGRPDHGGHLPEGAIRILLLVIVSVGYGVRLRHRVRQVDGEATTEEVAGHQLVCHIINIATRPHPTA